jgi:hypothetical protein
MALQRFTRRAAEAAQVPLLLRRYWSIPQRQIETSVVLAEKAWLEREMKA